MNLSRLLTRAFQRASRLHAEGHLLSVASSVLSDPAVTVMSFVHGLYPAFSQRKECLPGASLSFAGVYPTLSPSTNTSARYGTELTLTTPVGTSGAEGGVDGAGGAGGAAVVFSGAAAGASSKPIMEC